MSQDLNPSKLHVHLRSFSCIGHAKTTYSMQRQPRSCSNIPSFLQWTAPIARSSYEVCTCHHVQNLVKAPLCCDWKGRAASAHSFTLWYQTTIKKPRRAHFISVCSGHMAVVLHGCCSSPVHFLHHVLRSLVSLFFFSLCLFDVQLLFLNTYQKMINGVGWLDDLHGLSPILYDAAPLFVYTDQLLCHCVFICSKVR